MRAQSCRRSSLRPRVAAAFAPAAITNFFSVGTGRVQDSDFSRVGATGGGYILSKGVVSVATVGDGGGRGLHIIVDGDPDYSARTTRRALEHMLEAHAPVRNSVLVEQKMDVPVGCGFGASAASAVSACYALAAALGLDDSKAEIAYHAHVADILEKTGLGTVSVSFDAIGAGAIVTPGGPGVSKFLNVSYPDEIRIVTASLGPYRKSNAISNPEMVSKIQRLGDASLHRFVESQTLETLASEGERFSSALGLMTPQLAELAASAKRAGATHASQNMIGYAIHALAPKDEAPKVAKALRASRLGPRVGVFRIGKKRAGVLRGSAG